ncbi:MAG: PEP-CTERM sorting domain-containing protein [Acidobacteria bacterium]|nr:PEP-CTERM sorting domain-containing protein [Acidobacteriota bacterium]
MRKTICLAVILAWSASAAPLLYTEATTGFYSWSAPYDECPSAGTSVGTKYASRDMPGCALVSLSVGGHFPRGSATSEAKASYGKLEVYAEAWYVGPQAIALARFSDELTIFGAPFGILNLSFNVFGGFGIHASNVYSSAGDLLMQQLPGPGGIGIDQTRVVQIPWIEGVPVPISSEIYVDGQATQGSAQAGLTETLTITAFSDGRQLKGIRYKSASGAAYRFPGAIPEPSTYAMLLTGLGLLAGLRSRRSDRLPHLHNRLGESPSKR